MKVTEPKVTGNAILLCGFVSGMIRFAGNGPYEVEAVSAESATLTIKHSRNGNTYRLAFTQIGGSE